MTLRSTPRHGGSGRSAAAYLRRHARGIVRAVALIVFATVTVLVPLWLVIINSVKPFGEASALGIGLPDRWALEENYHIVISQGRVDRGLLNTLAIAIPSVVGVVVLGSMAAWVFARVRRRAVTAAYLVSIAGILLPPAIVTTIQVLKVAQLYGTHFAVIAFYMGVFLSFGIFLITGFVKTVPVELEEAARIDGAGSLTVFFRIILPLLAPVILTASFILLVLMWNDFFYPFFLIGSSDQATLQLGLYNFVSGYQYQIRWNLVFANIVLVSLPIIAVYVLVQRWVVEGLTGGATR